MLLIFGDGAFGDQSVLAVIGTRKNSGQRVVVLHGEGIVFVVVAPGTTNREAQEGAREGVHPVVALVGPRLRRLHQVVVPRPEAEEACAGNESLLIFRVK